MLDWIRYFPLALDRSSKETPVQGPYFKKPVPEGWLVADSVFHFSAPKSQSIYGSSRTKVPAESKSPYSDNINTLGLMSYTNVIPNNRWHSAWFFVRQWYFVGPWFSGLKARFGMSAIVVGPNDLDDYQEASFFHPRVFESVIADYLSSRYGHYRSRRSPHYQGPLNWSTLNLCDTMQAACFDIEKIEGSGYERIVVFPISHNRFIKITFSFVGKCRISPYLPPMMALAEQVIKTFGFEMGDKTRQEWDKVKQICSDMSLTDTFGQLQWPIKPEDVGKPQVVDETKK